MLAGGSSSGIGRSGSRRPRFPRIPLTHPSSSSTQPNSSSSAPACTAFDLAYFQAYSDIGIHEEMLKDRVRMETYQDAISRYRHLIEGKIVMDVGSGTGILAIFCAQAGAKKVYAVEASDIAEKAKEIVRANNLAEKVIVLHQRVEDVEISGKVDVIISEWMGYMLVYESMLSSVIFARDKWLKRGGLILPSHATLYMAPVTNSIKYEQCVDFWNNVYGIDMSAMVQLARQCAFEEPSVETIQGENVLTWPFVVKSVNCYTVVAQELECISAEYRFSSMMDAPLHGFAFWFDVEFNGPAITPVQGSHYPLQSSLLDLSTNESANETTNDSNRQRKIKSNETIVLSTAPEDAPTHWQQTLLYFYYPTEVKKDQIIEGSIKLSQNRENARFINILLKCSCGGNTLVKESVLR
ncbi:Histone-arginine N-methyltransferase protein [Dioscorea alata]|uniref:Histone-arginine N-methyltransferase protein n=1 Tax=Dioscorea alata TaxID=55571 RepID=A0ACB7WUN8_DIOAL|nr:Histone-arginine N-methyltransferase protein [Dioscorea alata]